MLITYITIYKGYANAVPRIPLEPISNRRCRMQKGQTTRAAERGGPVGENHTDTDLEQLDFDAINSVFSLRRPRDLRAGLASGGKSVVKGLLAGTVGLVAAPAIGAVSEGWGGFAKGVGVGVAGAVLLPVTGLGIGVAQAVRGAINTPEAIREASRGRHWDQEQRAWMDTPSLAVVLDDELFGAARERWNSDPANQASTSGRADTDDFYELLGVQRTASPEQIKRQYYIMARKMHPDKNPGDPQAKDRFQRLGEAYQVLGNAELRERYDRHGAQGLDINFMDASEFFTMLFGSDKFEHLVGELMIAAAARNGGEFTFVQIKKLQVVRSERLTIMLKALLRRWVEGDQQGFEESMWGEGRMLSSTSYGAKILLTLGRIYELQADIALGGIIDGTMAGIKSRVHTLKTQMSAAGMAIKVFQAQQKMEKFEREAQTAQSSAASKPGRPAKSRKTSEQNDVHAQEGPDPVELHLEQSEARQRMEEAALPLMLDAMWAANVLDIESTVRAVCKKALGDQTVDKAVRRKRAQGLKVMGHIFQDSANKVLKEQVTAAKEEKPRLAKQQMEDAMQRVMEKRHELDERLYGHGWVQQHDFANGTL